MKTIKFILQKIVIVEVMLIILYLANSFFGVNISIFNLIINTGLEYLTPIAIISAVLYVIFSILSFKIVEVALGVVLGGIILYYVFNYLM